MIPNRIVTRFQDDNRAVAPLIGFIFLFGFLVIAFIGYQAQVVPQQNAETEFEHFEENRYELIELKNAIMDAGSSSRAQYPNRSTRDNLSDTNSCTEWSTSGRTSPDK